MLLWFGIVLGLGEVWGFVLLLSFGIFSLELFIVYTLLIFFEKIFLFVIVLSFLELINFRDVVCEKFW